MSSRRFLRTDRSASVLHVLPWSRPRPRAEIAAFRDARLRALVAHAYRRVPYYRRLFDQSRLRPDDIRTVADLARIPVTSKRDLQSLSPWEIVADGIDPNRLLVHRTSGSSGEPLAIRRTWLEQSLLGAHRLRAIWTLGFRFTDRTAAVVLVRPNGARDLFPLPALRALGLLRETRIDCRLPVEEIARRVRDYRPDVVGGFAAALARVAQTGGTGGLGVRPRFVMVGGEVMTAMMRSRIEEAFGARVLDLYASHEFGLIASECPQTGELHTSDETIIVEVLRNGCPAREGERGDVVGTNLHAFAMPFLRYRLGDLATRGADVCRCGRPLSTIRGIHGRMIDYFPLPGGRVIHPYAIVTLLVGERLSWIRQYRLVQERLDRITLLVVAAGSPPAEDVVWLEDSVRRVVGRDVEFRVVPVAEIPAAASGKFRVSCSLVESPYEGIDWASEGTG